MTGWPVAFLHTQCILCRSGRLQPSEFSCVAELGQDAYSLGDNQD